MKKAVSKNRLPRCIYATHQTHNLIVSHRFNFVKRKDVNCIMKINIGKNDICFTCQYGKKVQCDAGVDDVFIDDLGCICDCKCYLSNEFVKPTTAEINFYCFEKGYTNVDANAFIDYYDSVGWMVGKKPMKSWKGAVSNWERKGVARKKQQKEKQQNNVIEITYENIEQLRTKYPDFDWDEYDEEDFKPRFDDSKFGKGVVLLSRVQEDIFLETVDDYLLYDHYIEMLADFIIKKKPNIRSHFNLLMKWYRENFRCFNYGG